MAVTWTEEQILAYSPDASSTNNGKVLAFTSKWLSLGCNDQAVWGECKGSGKNPYLTGIDLSQPAFKCSCPSRKFPCKHSLGLFLLLANEPSALSENTPPTWVKEWLDNRSQKKAQTEVTKEPAPKAQAQRAEKRAIKVEKGIQDLELWLGDIVHQGLATVQTQPYSFWDTAAARLVDAQAPGVARWVRKMAGIPYSGAGWQERMLAQLGQLYLLITGFKHIETLPADVQADIRTQIGWTQSQQDLLTKEGIKDCWLILGQRVEAEDRLQVQRNWLWGQQTQQSALILNFTYGSQPLDKCLVPGTCIDGELVFFESAYALRALIKTRNEILTETETIPGYKFNDFNDMMSAYAQALGCNPWLEQFPIALQSVIPVQQNKSWFVRDPGDHLLPLKPISSPWQLLALSGGHAVDVFGEWDGQYFLPLSVWGEDGFNLLRSWNDGVIE